MLRGPIAISDFRRAALMRAIKSTDITAEFIHVIQGELSENLALLLHYNNDKRVQLKQKPTNEIIAPEGFQLCLVFPRPGTISPWSSKATEIAKMSALNVSRIERGIVYLVKQDEELSLYQKSLLHDKMTHVVFDYIPDMNVLFPTSQPRMLKSVALVDSTSPKDILQKANLDWVFYN
jgi:phosphoribosylformylglycinamidine synthase